jgi:hypothetical protein
VTWPSHRHRRVPGHPHVRLLAGGLAALGGAFFGLAVHAATSLDSAALDACTAERATAIQSR